MLSASDKLSGRTESPSASLPQSPRVSGSGRVLTLSEAESYGPVLSAGTGDPGGVDPEQILELLRVAYRAGLAVGVDTEYLTDDLQRSNCHRARVHIASLGLPKDIRLVRRGDMVPVAARVVLGAAALPAFHRWFASDHKKVLYNAPADLHALAESGVVVGNWEDLLGLSRYLAPDHRDHSLKWHIQHSLGYVGQGEYKQNFYTFKIGVKGQTTKQRVPIPLAEIVPGHPLWEKLKVYAALDAKATVELYYKWRMRHPSL